MGDKQDIDFRPNHRDMSPWNCYLFEHKAVFVLFLCLKKQADPKTASFLGVPDVLRGESIATH